MNTHSFFVPTGPWSLAALAERTGASVGGAGNDELQITSAGPIEAAGPGCVTFLDNAKYLDHLATTKASAVYCAERFIDRAPAGLTLLVHDKPSQGYAAALSLLFPTALRPQPVTGETGVSPNAHVSEGASLEHDVVVEAGAVIGKQAAIGAGSHILAGSVVGAGVQIGRNCAIGPRATVTNTLMGDRVIVHAGASVGQDGFGYATAERKHRKIPQIGRVVIQDDVEIGANSTIDRGANRDTVIGEGTKIDNLVQIGHNVVIGRHCIIVGLVGISGSATLGDYVIVGGQAGIVGHITIGDGAQVGGGSGVHNTVAAGERVMGYPAIPASQWMRAAARRMRDARKGKDE